MSYLRGCALSQSYKLVRTKPGEVADRFDSYIPDFLVYNGIFKMIKTFLAVAYTVCWIMSVFCFAMRDFEKANYFALWGIVNYMLHKDAK